MKFKQRKIYKRVAESGDFDAMISYQIQPWYSDNIGNKRLRVKLQVDLYFFVVLFEWERHIHI